MNSVFIPKDYKAPLPVYDTQRAIEFIKLSFQRRLCGALKLKRVSAPLFVRGSSGLNDDLNGVERAVSFDIPAVGCEGQVVHSLAKWKRLALKRYDFRVGNGLYTDMNAIRRDEELDNIHSVYVDQWDWEKIITKEDRNLDFLYVTARAIVDAVCDTLDELKNEFPTISTNLCRNVACVTTSELLELYPNLTPHERENEFLKKHKTAFISQIGGKLKDGKSHDGRAPDYDDWSLNGDIMFYNELLGRAFEISSMGIRVDEKSLAEQLKEANCEQRAELPFHKALLQGELPLTMGGGIGQSRLCMLMLGNAHIGEVQSSIWDNNTVSECKKAGIMLL